MTTTTECQPISTTVIQPEIAHAASSMTRNKAASSLSALLVPGGQIPPYRPLGRSTITKVPSPNLNPVAEHYQNDKILTDLEKPLPEFLLSDNEKKLVNDRLVKDEAATQLLEQVNTFDDNAKIIEDGSFNWYFQHYNDTNLEPYIGLVYSGADRVNVFTVSTTVVYLIFCKFM